MRLFIAVFSVLGVLIGVATFTAYRKRVSEDMPAPSLTAADIPMRVAKCVDEGCFPREIRELYGFVRKELECAPSVGLCLDAPRIAYLSDAVAHGEQERDRRLAILRALCCPLPAPLPTCAAFESGLTSGHP